MAAFAGDFDDLPEDDSVSQPLPAEDRLWRHPSELGPLGSSLPLDPITVRRRWLASQPSKASAWTAGLVGALLATGLVALGTHLASAMTAKAAVSTDAARSSAGTTGATGASGRRGAGHPVERALGSTLSSSMAAVGKAVVYLEVSRGTTEVRCLGVGVRSDGMLLVPAAAVSGATSIMVLLANGVYYVGEVVGSDLSARAASSGLALVHVQGVTDMPVARLDAATPPASSTIGIALTAPGANSYSIGSVSSASGTMATPSTILVDALTTDLSPGDAPPGSPLLGTNGSVVGIVTASNGGKAVATPSWIAAKVVAELASKGSVVHGWLGIEGVTNSGNLDGVRVTKVAAGSAAYAAGLRVGDVIVGVDGTRVATMAALQGRLYFFRPGTRTRISVVRGGRTMVVRPLLDGEQMK